MKTRARAGIRLGQGETGVARTKLQLHRQHCRVFCLARKKFNIPKLPVEESTGKRGFRPGQKVKHPKYGEDGLSARRDGEDAKLTVQFPRFGLKKLVEKYAQLERA